MLAGQILHLLTSTQSRIDLVRSRRPRVQGYSCTPVRPWLPNNRQLDRAEAHEHENGRSWALITSTETGQRVVDAFLSEHTNDFSEKFNFRSRFTAVRY